MNSCLPRARSNCDPKLLFLGTHSTSKLHRQWRVCEPTKLRVAFRGYPRDCSPLCASLTHSCLGRSLDLVSSSRAKAFSIANTLGIRKTIVVLENFTERLGFQFHREEGEKGPRRLEESSHYFLSLACEK